ncbi:MAG: NAD(P)H:quinone oxidoreductase [Armatimonadetes bacterium]|nr:NAD(P)H:quinone oxidoreductase [Armatimonadota bacterium]
MAKVAIVYYSATGTCHALAKAAAEGAEAAGAEVRLRLVTETVPEAVIARNERWQAFVESTKDAPRAQLDDLDWADGIIFGTPTRFGNAAAQLKAFIDTAGGLWFAGKLANKVYAGFTSSQTLHGGQESTLLSLYTSFYHFGGIIATPGYTDASVFAAGGNPYGPSTVTGPNGDLPTEAELAHARYMGQRVAELAARLRD